MNCYTAKLAKLEYRETRCTGTCKFKLLEMIASRLDSLGVNYYIGCNGWDGLITVYMENDESIDIRQMDERHSCLQVNKNHDDSYSSYDFETYTLSDMLKELDTICG